jgi:hypothetical protein
MARQLGEQSSASFAARKYPFLLLYSSNHVDTMYVHLA